jgi:hypothetical protein
MLVANRAGKTVMIKVEYLNFGKLLGSADGSIAAAEGLGVTRRSSGLDPARDGELRLSALLDVQFITASMIDPSAEAGLLLVRVIPPAQLGASSRTVLVRARLRQDFNPGVGSRMYQQAAIWVVDANDWRMYARSILTEAADLRADPDRADETGRFSVPARDVLLSVPEMDYKPRSLPVRRILDMVLPDTLMPKREDDQCITFGGDVFATEEDFLIEVGRALSELPPDFASWNDICIGSNLRQTRNGLLIRYLASETTEETDDVDDASIRRRLDQVRGEPARTNHAGYSRAENTAVPNSGGGFTNILEAYRRQPNSMSGRQLIESADRVNQALGLEIFASRPDLREALQAIVRTYSPPESSLSFAALYDGARLLANISEGERNAGAQWFQLLSRAVAARGILLPAELARLDRCDLTRRLDRSADVAIRHSRQFDAWIKRTLANEWSLIKPDDPYLFKALPATFRKLLDADSVGNFIGIHDEQLAAGDMILNASEVRVARLELVPCLAQQLQAALLELSIVAN